MNLYDLEQEIMIVPELDSHLKVVVRESFGVNAKISLCRGYGTPTSDCFLHGTQIGTTKILFSEELKQDQTYTILLDYSSSILAFHHFDQCPHLEIEISMVSTSEIE